jgi:hypothetical protein
VNLVSRLERLYRPLGRSVLISGAVAAETTGRWCLWANTWCGTSRRRAPSPPYRMRKRLGCVLIASPKSRRPHADLAIYTASSAPSAARA